MAEGEMQGFWNSVELMAFVYVLAAVVSFAMAGIIKLIFVGVQLQKTRTAAHSDAPDDSPPEKAA